MKTLHSLSLAAALSLASTVCAQAQTPPNPTETQRGSQTKTDSTAPSAASSPHQRSSTSTTSQESPASGSTEPGAASSQHQRDAMPAMQAADARMNGKTDKHGAKLVGTKVQMSTGESLGEVKEVLLDTQGNPSYAVISHGGAMGVGAKRTAVPWATVKSAMQNDKLIMDRSQLEQAPVLPRGKTPDASSGTWSRDADTYWRTKVSIRSPSPATGSNGNTSPSNASPAPVKQYN
jgi:sporulation protein YlmC with PRC-barrel domain